MGALEKDLVDLKSPSSSDVAKVLETYQHQVKIQMDAMTKELVMIFCKCYCWNGSVCRVNLIISDVY